MINSKLDNGTLTLSVVGEFSINLFPEFQAAYTEQKFNELVIDFSDAKSIDSGGLGMLLQMRTHLGDQASHITLNNISPEILKVFEVVNFEKLFKMT